MSWPTHFFLLVAVLFLHQFRQGGQNADRALLIAGISSGLMAGIKVQGLVWVAVVATLLVPWLLEERKQRQLAVALRSLSLRFILPVLALWTPWLMKAVILTGNPFYPFFFNRFGGPQWSIGLSDQFRTWQLSLGMGREFLDYLLLPVRVILSGDLDYVHFGHRLGAYWIVLIPLAIWSMRRKPLARRCHWVVALVFIFWALSSQQTRFLVPLLPLLAVTSAAGLIDFAERIPKPKLQRLVKVSCVVVTWSWIGWSHHPYHQQLGSIAEPYLRGDSVPEKAFVPPVLTYANRALPPEAKLLFLNSNQGFFCERSFVADSFFEVSQIADWLSRASDVQQVRHLLTERGITHVLIWENRFHLSYPRPLIDLISDPRQVEVIQWDRRSKHILVALRPL